MIRIRDRYVPSAKALSAIDPPSPKDETYRRPSEKAYAWLASLLMYQRVQEVKFENGMATVMTQALGRNTESLFETTFSGSLEEMLPCLALVYYWYDGFCVEPPADYPFSQPEHRQQVLESIWTQLPLRDAVGALLRQGGYEPLVLEGMYDLRGCARAWVGVMACAGIADPLILQRGAAMNMSPLVETCEFVRVFGMSFDEALAQVPAAAAA